MDLMEIKVLLKPDGYVLDAVFHLFNSGQATTEWVGFPKHGQGDLILLDPQERAQAVPQFSEDNPWIRDFISFDGWVDGSKEEFVEKRSFLRDGGHLFSALRREFRARAETRWMVKEVRFSEQAATTIPIRMEARYDYAASSQYSLVQQFACFFFGPGQYWKGKIGKATIVLENLAMDAFPLGILFSCPGRLGISDRHATRESFELTELSCGPEKSVKFGNFGSPKLRP